MTQDDSSLDPNELVTVFTVNDPIEAEILKNFLNAEGIACQIAGEGQAGLTGVMEIELLAKAVDADRAEKLIRQREPKPDDD